MGALRPAPKNFPPKNYVQEDPRTPPQNGRRRDEWVVGECYRGRRGVEIKRWWRGCGGREGGSLSEDEKEKIQVQVEEEEVKKKKKI